MSGSKSSAPGATAASPDAPEAIALTVHGVDVPDFADATTAAQGRTRRGRIKMLIVLLVCAAPVIASYLTYFVIRPDGRTNYGTLILPTRTMPDLALHTLQGDAVAARSLRGQWLMVLVGPSTCDKPCEERLFAQRQLREMMGRERDRLDKIWLVTDDGPLSPTLREALGGKAPVTVLRADPGAVAGWLAPAAGQALQDHLYIVDPMGEWMMRMPPQPEPGRVKRDLDRVLRASAFWDKAGR